MKIIHYADLIAIPFFMLLVFYFYRKKRRNRFENILYLFSIGGVIMDIYFTRKHLFILN